MRGAMLELRRSLAELAPRAVRALSRPGLGLQDLVGQLEAAPALRDWFEFRAAVLARGLAQIGSAVHAAKPNATFAIQGLYPSLAGVVGQQPGSCPSQVDQVVYMMSYVREVALRFVVGVAQFAMAANRSVREDEALALAFRLAGWSEAADRLPGRIAELQARIGAKDLEWNPWYERVVSDEIRKAARVTRNAGVMVGLRGNTWPKAVADRLREEALEQGATGVVYHSYTLPWS
jgi:hypothetical protein